MRNNSTNLKGKNRSSAFRAFRIARTRPYSSWNCATTEALQAVVVGGSIQEALVSQKTTEWRRKSLMPMSADRRCKTVHVYDVRSRGFDQAIVGVKR